MEASQVLAYPYDLPAQHLPSQEVHSWNLCEFNNMLKRVYIYVYMHMFWKENLINFLYEKIIFLILHLINF